MPIQKPDYQLTLSLDLEEPVTSDQSLAISPEEARLRSEAARSALEGRTDLKWMDEYRKLREGGWHWRVAAYIAWASSPHPRAPKTQDELARQHLGLTSDRAIATWRRKNPAIDEMVITLQSAPLWDYRASVFQALTANAVKPDYKTHNDRKLFFELTGDYVPSARLAALFTKGNITKNDLNDMTDEELAALARSLMEEGAKSAKELDGDDDSNKA
jgi:hypothetical protein